MLPMQLTDGYMKNTTKNPKQPKRFPISYCFKKGKWGWLRKVYLIPNSVL
jgi:hypothetical protein